MENHRSSFQNKKPSQGATSRAQKMVFPLFLWVNKSLFRSKWISLKFRLLEKKTVYNTIWMFPPPQLVGVEGPTLPKKIWVAWGEILYKHLFRIAPVTKKLFPLSVRMKYRDWTNSTEEVEFYSVYFLCRTLWELSLFYFEWWHSWTGSKQHWYAKRSKMDFKMLFRC